MVFVFVYVIYTCCKPSNDDDDDDDEDEEWNDTPDLMNAGARHRIIKHKITRLGSRANVYKQTPIRIVYR
jgi:hypothetical protein